MREKEKKKEKKSA